MKQRLIGALVLGCLAVIFIPMLLDGEGMPNVDITAEMPPAPPLPTVPEVEPQRPRLDSEAEVLPESDLTAELPTSEPDSGETDLPVAEEPEEAVAQALPETAAPSASTTVESFEARLDSSGLPEAWSVRLATFAEPDNARSLVSRLLRNDYKGYSRPVESSRGRLTAVYVGPVLERAEANALRSRLEDQFSLSGIVEKYDIDELQD